METLYDIGSTIASKKQKISQKHEVKSKKGRRLTGSTNKKATIPYLVRLSEDRWQLSLKVKSKACVAGDSCPLPRSPSLRSGAGVSPTPKAKKTAGLTQVAPTNGHPVIKYLATHHRIRTPATYGRNKGNPASHERIFAHISKIQRAFRLFYSSAS